MSIRSLLGNWIAQHNQLLWFRSNGQRLERSQVPRSCRPLLATGACPERSRRTGTILTRNAELRFSKLNSRLPVLGNTLVKFCNGCDLCTCASCVRPLSVEECEDEVLVSSAAASSVQARTFFNRTAADRFQLEATPPGRWEQGFSRPC